MVPYPDAASNGPPPKKIEKKEAPELSEEDAQYSEELEMLVRRMTPAMTADALEAFQSLQMQVRGSSSLMTSLPKPLRFLRPHLGHLKEVHVEWPDGGNKKDLADLISFISMTDQSGYECFKYYFLGMLGNPASWGNEYVRRLADQLTAEENSFELSSEQEAMLVGYILDYFFANNGEIEACDLCIDALRFSALPKYVNRSNVQKIGLYMISLAPYFETRVISDIYDTVHGLYIANGCYTEAAMLAIRTYSREKIPEIMAAVSNQLPLDEAAMYKKQIAYMMGSVGWQMNTIDEDPVNLECQAITWNSRRHHYFLTVCRELDIMEPKVPDDVYKHHLETRPFSGSGPNDVAKLNVATAIVNGFLNAGFSEDKLILVDNHRWMFKCRDLGIVSAAASIGLISLWDYECGMSQCDRHLYSEDDYEVAGALIGIGLASCGVHSDCDAAFALASDFIRKPTPIVRTAAAIGMGLSLAGTLRADVVAELATLHADPNSNMETIAMAALAQGLVMVQSCDGELTSSLINSMIERSPAELKENSALLMVLGLGLLYLGRESKAAVPLATLKATDLGVHSCAHLLVDICAHVGTGTTYKIQELLHSFGEHTEQDEEQKNNTSASPQADTCIQGITTLGLALLALGNDINVEMTIRMMGNLLQYGDPATKRAVPLALSLLCISDPKYNVTDTLNKLSHDHDSEVAYNAIIAMGLVGAGTNNARIAGLLRQLASYYSKDTTAVFCVRLAQGLVHAGKGTLTLNPYHFDRLVLNPVAVGGLMAFLISCLDVKSNMVQKSHYLIYWLGLALRPRTLLTMDKDNNPVAVQVRVGQAVDTVGQVGKPKTITGFQTHHAPVLLAVGERAELANDEYLSYSPFLEGIVLLKKNPNYEADQRS